MTDQVRVGVIGTGWYNDMMHLPILQNDPRANPVSICGRNRDTAEAMASKYGIPQVYTDYQEMFEKDQLDAVVVASPDHLHYPMTMAALEAGRHVMCEKPLASTAELVREAGTLEVDIDYGRPGFEMRGARDGEEQITAIPTPAHILRGVDLNGPLIDHSAQIFKEQRLGLYLFFEAIVDGKPVPHDFSVGVKVQEVVDAAIEPDKRGCWIALPRGGAA